MRRRLGAAGVLLLLAGAAWPSAAAAGTPKETLTIGAALSLTGSLSREGVLTREGYDRCADVVNRKGGVHIGDRTYRLALRYQDDQSTPDVASRLVEQMNSSGVRLLLGPYGSASTEAAEAAGDGGVAAVALPQAEAAGRLGQVEHEAVLGPVEPVGDEPEQRQRGRPQGGKPEPLRVRRPGIVAECVDDRVEERTDVDRLVHGGSLQGGRAGRGPLRTVTGATSGAGSFGPAPQRNRGRPGGAC